MIGDIHVVGRQFDNVVKRASPFAQNRPKVFPCCYELCFWINNDFKIGRSANLARAKQKATNLDSRSISYAFGYQLHLLWHDYSTVSH